MLDSYLLYSFRCTSCTTSRIGDVIEGAGGYYSRATAPTCAGEYGPRSIVGVGVGMGKSKHRVSVQEEDERCLDGRQRASNAVCGLFWLLVIPSSVPTHRRANIPETCCTLREGPASIGCSLQW